MGRMSGPAFVVLVLVLVTAPAVLLLLVVPKREPWKVVHIAAWTWIGVLGFFGINYLLRACQAAALQ